MAFSIQTNVNALVAQENLRVNSNFQSQTIQRLTSGYRINSSADDAAGLAVANKFRSDVAELSQGVRNANDGVSSLQIIDSGMNNVSKMLDRLRTLATQSASSTFTGDRGVLNSEFQSLLSEIDRQAQSIGLNRGGSFAKSLSVFLGGGKDASTGALDTSNGSVTVDLRNSTVDTASLGLKYTQVKAGVSDVAASVGDTNNKAALSDSKTTTFYFAGPGFSDGSKVKVTVDTTGITNAEELASALNTAITTAGNGTSAAAAALKSAGIVAGVDTSSATGDKAITFTSATSAFQVEAGDKMANALLGNLKGGSTTEGIDMTALVKGSAAVADGTTIASPTSVKVRITGGGLGSEAVEFSLNAGKTTGALAGQDIEDQVAANDLLKAAGITADYTSGQALTFSNQHGEKFDVMITGDTQNALKFGAWQSGSVPAVDYSSYSNSGYAASTSYGTATLTFSINGGAAAAPTEQVSVNLAQGDATKTVYTAGAYSAVTNGETFDVVVDGTAHTVTMGAAYATADLAAAKINTDAGTWVTASVNAAGRIVLTSVAAGGHTISIAEGTGAGADSGLVGGSTTTQGVGRSGQNIADALNSEFDKQTSLSKAGLKAAWDGSNITISSSNGTNFRLNADALGASHNDIGFGSGGAVWTGAVNTGSTYNTVADANGTTHTGGLTFNAMTYGSDTQTLTISANDSTGALQSKSITLSNKDTTHTGRTIDEAIAHINSQLQASQNTTLQKIIAVKELGSTEKINFVSSLTGFTVNLGASANGNGFSEGLSTGTPKVAGALGTGGSVSIDSESKATQAVTSVANALASLGTKQAAVGKGQNQLNYAIGLAQSQITNFSAAESRIRDADVASEAANLTKAQVLQQAAIAAMAQANSAPQAVLSLLRG